MVRFYLRYDPPVTRTTTPSISLAALLSAFLRIQRDAVDGTNGCVAFPLTPYDNFAHRHKRSIAPAP
jgi:hypothetical protein